MIHLPLILLWYIKVTASENPLACQYSTIRPGNGLPFYQIISERATYDSAQRTCRELGSEILTIKKTDEAIVSFPSRMWLSARRTKWIHEQLKLGSFLNITDLPEPTFEHACISVDSKAEALRLVSCTSECGVVCVNDNITELCRGGVFDHRCHFVPNKTIQMQFAEAVYLCDNQSAVVVAVRSEGHLSWLLEKFRFRFWTGYQYDPGNDKYYWPDGSVVTNAKWDEGQPGRGDCAVINEHGSWESSDCDEEYPFACTLEVPYGSQNNVICMTVDEECYCYWHGADNRTFHEAMASCLSNGGTLFYPNKRAKMIYISRSEHYRYWIGVSQGYTPGLFRGADSSAISWANWGEGQPKINEGKDCVYVDNGKFYAESCLRKMKYICQSRPDPKLYPCSLRRGCTEASPLSWQVRPVYEVAAADLEVQNVATFVQCWTLCRNYIGFVCLIVTYDEEAEWCQLGRETGNQLRNDTQISLLRTEINIPPSWYCIKNMNTSATFERARRICAEERGQWVVPFILDDVMQRKLANIGRKTWINAKLVMKGVYGTDRSQYILYSNWTFEQRIAESQKCVGSQFGAWFGMDCNDNLNVACMAYKDVLCMWHPDITHGTVNTTTGRISCEPGYYIPGINAINYTLACDCRWAETISTMTFCKAIECPEPLDTPSGRVKQLNGKRINDTVVYQCRPGTRVRESGAVTYTLTCNWIPNTITAEWSKIPEIEDNVCSEPRQIPNAHLQSFSTNINKNATYICDAGYRVSGEGSIKREFNITCSLDDDTQSADWTESPQCEAILCEEPLEIPNAQVTFSTTDIGAVVNYKCDAGYRVANELALIREFRITCLLDENMLSASWSTPAGCIVIQCSKPPDVPNANLGSYTRIVGGAAEYSCTSGYRIARLPEIITGFQIRCIVQHDSAIWTTPPVCEAMLCPEPPAIQNGKVQVNGYHRGDTATYICDAYHKLSGEGIYGFTRSCEAVCVFDPFEGFIWRPIPACIRETASENQTPIVRQCPQPVQIERAKAYYQDTHVNSVVTYVTDPGYKFDDGSKDRSLICLPNGQWSSYRPNAKRKECPEINIDGASKSSDNHVPGTLITITCDDPRAKMENGLSKVKIKCTELGKWSYTPKSCRVNRCKPFPYLERSRLTSFNNTVGGLAEIQCNEGTSFPDGKVTKSFRCLPHLDWEEPDLCLVNRCPSLSLPRNGTISTDIVLVGIVVEVKCLRGYMFPDRSTTKQIVCQSDRKWNDTLQDCQVLRCPDLPTVKNSVRSSNDTSYDSNITYTCETPYRTEYGFTEVTMRCQENARWSHTSPTCDLGRCPAAPDIENAQPDGRLATNGTTLVYRCNEGYVLPDTNTEVYISCDGVRWNYTTTACAKIKCPHLNLTHASWKEKGNSFGDVVDFVCDEGYEYNGQMGGVIKCTANSQWNGNTGGCQPKDCGPPPHRQYSTRHIPLQNVYGALVSYHCLENYWIEKGVTNTSIVCTKFGTWSEPSGECTLITCPAVPVWDNMEANTTDTVIGTPINISCTTEEGDTRQFMSSRCTANGEWQPPLDTCAKIKKAVEFEPEPEEAEASRSIGLFVVSCLLSTLLPIVLSDIPKIVRAMKGHFKGESKVPVASAKKGKKIQTRKKKAAASGQKRRQRKWIR